MLEMFQQYLEEKGKSDNTIKSYMNHVKGYVKWFEQEKQMEFTKLYQDNVKEYVKHLESVGNNPKTINAKLNAIRSLGEWFTSIGVQEHPINVSNAYQKVQTEYASLAKISKQDVEHFRQWVLENGSYRNYTIVTLLAYCGLRISEALHLKLNDIHLVSRELVVTGKGNKKRIVMISDKVAEVLTTYINERDTDSDYLFVSRQGNVINRTVINKLFKEYSTHRHFLFEKNFRESTNKNFQQDFEKSFTLTPHDLRHFFCSHALEIGFTFPEVANQAGHSNIQTTMQYTNPSKQKMLEKINQM